MSYLEELLPEFRKGAKIRRKDWEDGAYIEKRAQGIIYHNIEEHDVDILANDYEFYKGSIDWDSIIKNKCLCWFWDKEDNKFARYLNGVLDRAGAKFVDNANVCWYNCRPVRRDEAAFYVEREDEGNI